MASIMRQGIREVSLFRYLRLKFRTAVEVGMVAYYEKVIVEKFDFGNVLEVFDYSHLPLDSEQQAAYLKKCYSPTVNYNDEDVDQAVMANYRLLGQSCMLFMSAAVLTFMCEKGLLAFLVTLIKQISIQKILRGLRSKICKIHRRFRKLLAKRAVQPTNHAVDHA